MFWAFECNQRRIQPICLPVGLSLTPVASVTGDTKYEFVMTPILIELIAVPATIPGAVIGNIRIRNVKSRRPNQRQSDCVVIKLVRSVLIICQNRGAV